MYYPICVVFKLVACLAICTATISALGITRTDYITKTTAFVIRYQRSFVCLKLDHTSPAVGNIWVVDIHRRETQARSKPVNVKRSTRVGGMGNWTILKVLLCKWTGFITFSCTYCWTHQINSSIRAGCPVCCTISPIVCCIIIVAAIFT